MEEEKESYKKYLTATERETLLYLGEIRSALKLRNCGHIKLLITDLRKYIVNTACMRKRNKEEKTNKELINAREMGTQ